MGEAALTTRSALTRSQTGLERTGDRGTPHGGFDPAEVPVADPVWRKGFSLASAGEVKVTRREFSPYLVLASGVFAAQPHRRGGARRHGLGPRRLAGITYPVWAKRAGALFRRAPGKSPHPLTPVGLRALGATRAP